MHSIEYGKTDVSTNTNIQKIPSRICEQNFGAKNSKGNCSRYFVGYEL